MTKTNFIEGPLPLLFSCRIRLTEDQRQTLKAAYNKAKASADVQPTRIPGSTVTTSTAVNNIDLDRRLGMSSIVVSDLLNSRDSLSLPIILKMQSVLELTVVTEDDVLEACKSYVAYVFGNANG